MSDYEEELSALRRMRDGQTPLTREAFRRVRQQHSATHTHTHTHTDTHTDADTGAATATRTYSDTSTVRVVMPATKRRHSIRPLTALEASERVSDAVVERQENIDITDTTNTTDTTSLDTPSDRDHLSENESENERVSECVSDRESDPTPSQDQDQVLQTSPSHTSASTCTSTSASANVNVRVSKCESEEAVPHISLTAQHDRLTATVLVLLETLQEQGALRALLEHTGSVTTVDSEVGDSEGMQQRLTGTLLELEKTVNKVSVECTRMISDFK